MQFIPDENENTLLEQCLEGSTGLVNLVFKKFTPEVQRQLNMLVFSGARCLVEMELCPIPSVAATITANGHSIELFRIEAAPETYSETTH